MHVHVHTLMLCDVDALLFVTCTTEHNMEANSCFYHAIFIVLDQIYNLHSTIVLLKMTQ